MPAHYSRWDRRGLTYNKLFVEVIGSLKGLRGDAVAAALRKKLLSGGGTTRDWPSDQRVVETAISRPIYLELKAPALRQILERLELGLRGKKTEHDEISANLQIEHVLPRKWAQHWLLLGEAIPYAVMESPHMADPAKPHLPPAIRSRNSALHTLGNLTLLNQYLNPAASNGSLADKLVEYQHSVLRLNRHFQGAQEWDEKGIAARGRTLGEMLCKVWPRPNLEPAIAAPAAVAAT